jgi:transcriptional regulator with XRE-family HTH domain
MTRSNKNETKQSFADMFHELEQAGELYVEWAKIDVAEQISLAMRRRDVNKARLAGLLGKSRAYVTQILQGDANFTIESLVKIARALECELELKLAPKQEVRYWEFASRPAPQGKVLPWATRVSPAKVHLGAEVKEVNAPEPLAA